MAAPTSSGDASSPGTAFPASPPWVRLVGFALGVVLLAAAIFVVWGSRDEFARSVAAARAAPVWIVLATLALPLVNWGITSVIFWSLTRRFGSVRLGEMAMLIGSAWLLNMLPLKPGLVGRIAYHKAISNIPVATSVLVTLSALFSGGVGIVLALVLQVAADSALREVVPARVLAALGAGVVGMALLPSAAMVWVSTRRGRPVALLDPALAIAVLLRFADTHVWSLRYLLAFRLIGLEQPYGVCVVVAAVSQIAGQLPIQFGLREWAVGVSSAVLRNPAQQSAAATVAPGLAVDFICRAAEIACALPVGIWSTLWVFRHIRRKRGSEPIPAPIRGNSAPDQGV